MRFSILLICLIPLQPAHNLAAYGGVAQGPRLLPSICRVLFASLAVIQAPAPQPAHPDEIPFGFLESATEEESDNSEDGCGLFCVPLGAFLDAAICNLPIALHFPSNGSRSFTLRAVPLRC